MKLQVQPHVTTTQRYLPFESVVLVVRVADRKILLLIDASTGGISASE